MRDFYRIETDALNDFDVAVARFDSEGVLTYVNPAGQRLLGSAACASVTLRTLICDETQYAHIKAQLRERKQGKSSSYETTFRRVGARADEADIPVNIYAFPDTDNAGVVIGSVALIRDLREERARAAIHAATEMATSNVDLFVEVARHLRPLVGFDEFRVSLVSKSRKHIRLLYSSDKDNKKKFPHRWWPMPAFMQESLFEMVPAIIEADDLRRDPNHIELAKTDESMRRYLASDVAQILSIPIRHGNRIVAFFSLDTNTRAFYTPDDLALVIRLPVMQAVMSAINRSVQNRQNLVFGLVRRLAANAEDVRRVAMEMVECLGKHFGWSHVSIFQHDKQSARLRLICQANDEHAALPETFSLPCAAGAGPLSEALSSQQCINQPGSRAGSPFAALPGFKSVGSSLALPVIGRKMQWVLYVESTRLNAFSMEEEDMLELLAGEAAGVLHRSALFELQVAVLGSINDAVIETNNDGCVRWANEAAKQILGFDLDTNASIQMRALLPDDSQGMLMSGIDFRHQETTLNACGGRAVPVLLSASTLPKHLAGRVYVASDLKFVKESRQLDQFKEVFRHAALEGRIPLALAAAWLQQCAENRPLDKATTDKVIRQLGRADLPLERLLRLATPHDGRAAGQQADLVQALHTTLADLPDSLIEEIDWQGEKGPLPVGGEFNDLQFGIESMISFGMRTRPQSRKLSVRTERLADSALIRVCGDWAPDVGSTDPRVHLDRWRRKSLCDLTLGESVLAHIAIQAGGTFTSALDETLALEMTLPLRPERSPS